MPDPTPQLQEIGSLSAEERRASCAGCGAAFVQRERGRPRKYCHACRPSRWDTLTAEQRREVGRHVAAWFRDHPEQRARYEDRRTRRLLESLDLDALALEGDE